MLCKNVQGSFQLVSDYYKTFTETIIYNYYITGMSSRLCDYGGIWQQPNVSTCLTKKFIDLKNKVIASY